MDPKVLLAVYAKISQTYKDKEGRRFLSFPYLSYYSFDPDLLTQIGKDTGQMTAKSLQMMNDFSRHVNVPVKSSVYNSSSELYLWDVYSDIVNGAVVATGPESEAGNRKEYEDAINFLYADGNSLRQNFTPAYAKYRELDDQLYNVLSELTYATCDPARKDELTRQKADLEMRLATEGHASEVKNALAVIESMTKNNPACIWEKLKNDFEPDRSALRTPEGISFYPTYIYPSDINTKEWEKVVMYEDEIKKLSKEAPEEIKDLLSDVKDSDELVGITFECRSLKLDRPWMDSDVFESNQWRFLESDNHLPLSCGLKSQYGRFPAYVTSLILTRNVQVHTRTQQLQRVSSSRMRLQPKSKVVTKINTTVVDELNAITILAYNCKKLDVCPNPDPKADWGAGFHQGVLKLRQSDGGTIEAKVNGSVVDGGYFNEWQDITLTAEPDDGYILDSWMVNSQKYPSSSLKLTISMCSGGLDIRPVWKRGEKLKDKDYDISDDGKTLLKWLGNSAEVDMNASSELLKIERIGPDAFAQNQSLRRIHVGEHVWKIDKGAFNSCRKLEKIFVPASVNSIDEDWFSPMRSFEYPKIEVDSGNEVYEIVDGLLMDKGNVMNVKVATCSGCGKKYYYTYRMASASCPSCAAALTECDETVKIPRPERYLDFAHDKEAVITSLRKYFSSRSWLSKEFKNAIPVIELNISKVYLTSWQVDVDIKSDYQARVTKTENKAEGTPPVETIVKVDGEHESQIRKFQIPMTSFAGGSITMGCFDDAEKFDDGKVLNDALAELPDKSTAASLMKAQKLIEDNVRSNIVNKDRRISGKYELDITNYYSRLKYQPNLSPFWIGRYEFGEKVYEVLVNASNGKIVKCDYPKDEKKALIAGLIAAGIVAAGILLAILL